MIAVVVVLLLFGAVPTVSSCEDDEAGLAQLLIDNGRAETFGCADLKSFCGTDGQEGWVAGTYCCGTCGGGGESDATTDDGEPIVFDDSGLPPRDDGGKPLELYLLGGQSECVGAARASDLAADGDKYPELQGTIDGVWLAGYELPASPGSFLIAPMSADLDGYRFGPEVSFGERIRDAKKKKGGGEGSAANVMIVKYCLGVTNVREHWNPDTEANGWDVSEDDGTAAWLRSRTYFDEADKGNVRAHLFVNMVYTIRRTEEALREAGIPYGWSGIVWDQGPADNDPDDPNLWKTFGEDTARVWEGFRDAIGETVPIVDTGAAATNQMRSGKEYAVQIVEGGLAKNVEFSASSSDDSAGSCVITATETCLDDPHRFMDYRIFDHYGWDPLMPDEMIQELATKEPIKTFHWFVEFPSNLHSAYEGMILRGRMLANAFLRTFVADDESDLVAFGIDVQEDLAERFPSDRCPVGVKPSAGNFCWIDYRQGVPVPTAPQPSPTSSDEDVKSGGRSSSWSLSSGRRIFRRRSDGDDRNNNSTVEAAVIALICVTAIGPMLLLP